MQLSYSTLNCMEFETVLYTKPDFVLLDDVDQISPAFVKEALDRLGDRDISVFMTANDISKFDLATVRPGRLDRVVEFFLPNREERREVIQHYLDIEKAAPPKDWEKILDLTEGLAQAHCKEVAMRLRREPHDEVIDGLAVMQRLQKAKVSKEAPK